MEVAFTQAAERDLEAIGDWIAEDNPPRSITFIDELRERAVSLAEWPERCPVSRIGSDGSVIRCLNYRKYRILYRIVADRIEIVRILHGSRSDPA